MRRTLIILMLLSVGGVAGWYGWRHRPVRPLVLTGTIEADDVGVGSKRGGRIEEVLVQEGQAVAAGQVLLRLDRKDLDAQQARAQALYAGAVARLAELRNGSRPEEMAQARAAVAARAEQLRRAEHGYRTEEIAQVRHDWEAAQAESELAALTAQRQEALFATGDISAQQRDEATQRLEAARRRTAAAQARYDELRAGFRTEDVAAARAQLAEAQAVLDLVEAGPRIELIQQAEADVQRASAEIALIQANLDECDITTPEAGVLDVFDWQPGDLIAAGQAVATILLPRQLWVRVYVPEDQLGRVSVGQAAQVRVDTWPGAVFSGVVEQLNRVAEFTPRNVPTVEERVHLVFGVKVRLDDPGDRLRPGMSADVVLQDAAAQADDDTREILQARR